MVYIWFTVERIKVTCYLSWIFFSFFFSFPLCLKSNKIQFAMTEKGKKLVNVVILVFGFESSAGSSMMLS